METRGGKSDAQNAPDRLRAAVQQARIDQAERTSVVVDMREAELARLEILNDALDPLFAEVPAEVDLFDRGISRGETPRLWIDAIAHIGMGRDKRSYRFVQDTRHGRNLLAESTNVSEMVAAVTNYLAQRLVERERALAGEGMRLFVARDGASPRRLIQRRRVRAVAAFLCGLVFGFTVLFGAAALSAL